MTHPERLVDRAWPSVGEGLLVVVALGSVEQHGPHLPLDTDTRIASAVAAAVVAATRDAVRAPDIAYGASGEHEGFAGTISAGTEALGLLLVELGRSVSRWGERMLLVNGHGGNADALATAVPRLRAESHDVAWWPCSPGTGVLAEMAAQGAPPDSHAGRVETSLMLHLDAAVVDLEHATAGARRPLADLLPVLRHTSVAAVSPNGVLGDPFGASAAEGAMLLADMVTRASQAVAAWRPDGNGRLV